MRILVFDTDALLDAGIFNECLGCVSQARREKIGRYRLDDDKRLSLAAGMLLDIALADYGLREATAPFQYNSHKKPFLAEGPFFSISHSGTYAVCACGDCEVGADIERTRRVGETLVRRVCTPEETDRLLAMDERSRDREFVRLWAVKESVLKWLGTGISVDPRELSVSFDLPGGETALVRQELVEADLAVQEYSLEGYGFAVCCERGAIFPKAEFVEAGQLLLR